MRKCVNDFKYSLSPGESSGAYDIITGTSAPVAVDAAFPAKYKVGKKLPDFNILDLRGEAPRKGISNNFVTYTGFNKPSDTSYWKRVDFVFGGSNLGWYMRLVLWDGSFRCMFSRKISEVYKVGISLSADGTPASDHRPVIADVAI